MTLSLASTPSTHLHSIVTDHRPPTVPISGPSLHSLPAERTRLLASMMLMLNVSTVTSHSHRVPPVWCMSFPFVRTEPAQRSSRLCRCRASPNRGSLGTTISCMTESENTMRIIATGVNYTSPEPEDPSQATLSLDSAVISPNFQNSGQDDITSDGQGLFLILPPRPSANRPPKPSTEPNFE